MSVAPRITAVTTAVPPHKVSQAQVQTFVETLFADFPNLHRYLPVFENTLIKQRFFAQPLDWFASPHSFEEANALYVEHATTLALQAAEQALAVAGVAPTDIGQVVFVSTTGIATPSIDAQIIQRLGMSPHTARLPVWGLGCAGGVAGLGHAAALARTMPGRAVLLVALELCSLTFQHNDRAKSNLIASALFGDGAAALVLQTAGDGPAVLGRHSTLFPRSEAVMGWDVVADGLKVRFARSIPTIVDKNLPGLVAQAAASWGIDPVAIRHFVFHPGGARVLDAYAASLDLQPGQLAEEYAVLAEYGNMSSPSVLFVLQRFLANHTPSGDYGLMTALGPGFSAEKVLFQW